MRAEYPQDIFVIQRSVPVHGSTQLGLRSHPTGSVTHEAFTTTFTFVRSEKPIYTTMLIRPFSPCHSTRAMAGPIISHIRNSYPAFPGEVHDGWGAHMGFPRFLVFGPAEHKLHINVLELKALQHWSQILQGHHVMITAGNTTVVAYINKRGGTHSHSHFALLTGPQGKDLIRLVPQLLK